MKYIFVDIAIKESAKWCAKRVHVPYVLYVPYVPMRPTCPTCSSCVTCPRALRDLRPNVPKYILQTVKSKILVLMKSNEGSFTDVFKGAGY